MIRQRQGRRPTISRRVFDFFIYLIFVSIAAYLILNFQIFPYAAALAEAEAINSVNEIINTAVLKELETSGVSYGDFVKLSFDTGGKVSSAETDIVRLNSTRASLVVAVLSELQNSSIMRVRIPFGSILGGELLSGRGPLVEIRLLLAQGMKTTVDNEFFSAGINQTLHKIMLNLTVNIKLLIPTKNVVIPLENSFCIAETIIVGDVPSAFTQINRLLDDINESEINDLYDFSYSVRPQK